MKETILITATTEDTKKIYSWIDRVPQQETPKLFEIQLTLKPYDPASPSYSKFETFGPTVIIEGSSIKRSGYWLGFEEKKNRERDEAAGQKLPTVEDLILQILEMVGVTPQEGK